jgi:hypothetical protein
VGGVECEKIQGGKGRICEWEEVKEGEQESFVRGETEKS